MNITLLSKDTPAGQKLIEKFGDDTGQEIIDHFRKEGLPIDLPAQFIDGITLSAAPHLHLRLLDGKGGNLADGDEIARKHRWLLLLNGRPLELIKSVELPKLDYGDIDAATVRVEFYCAGKSVKCGRRESNSQDF